MFNGFDGDATTGGGSEGGGKQDPSVGKSSAVHDAQQGQSRKHGREDGDDGASGRGGNGSAGPGKKSRTEGFPFEINAKVAGAFGHDASAPVSNAVHTTAQGHDAQGTAYVGNIITIGKGKDKTPLQVAQQYGAEAFTDPADAAKRFAMVVGVNRMESVTDDGSATGNVLDQQVQAVTGFAGFPLTAFRKLWRPQWVHTDGANKGKVANFDEVRAAAADHQADAAKAEGALKMPPVGPMRTATTQQPATGLYTDQLKQHFANVYVHVGDSDAVNLKAKANPQAADQQPTGLFNRYDQVLGDQRAQGRNPQLVSGGYRFRVKNSQLPPDQQNADPHARGADTDAASVSRQTAASADLDMAVRHGLASHDPSAVYMPEPNMLVREDVARQPDFSFGDTDKGESKAAVASVMPADAKAATIKGTGKKKKDDDARDAEATRAMAVRQPWARENMVFDTRAALYTDGGRFENKMTKEFAEDSKGAAKGAAKDDDQDNDQDALKGADYAQGATDVAGLTHSLRNPQSIARKRALGNAISQMNSNIGDLLDVYLPQQLMKLSKKPEHGQDNKSTLDLVRQYLVTYETIATGIEQQLRTIANDPAALKIPPKTKSSKLSQPAIDSAQAKLQETQPKQLKEFSQDAYGDPNKLSEKLVAAVSAVKSAKSAKSAPAHLDHLLAMCRAAAIETAHFLAGFYPEAAPPSAQQIAQLQAAQQAHPDAMDVDPHPLV